MSNNYEAQLALLNICRNNQELYMKNQWQVAYYTFLLYGAIVFTQNLSGGVWCYYGLSIILCVLSIFVIVKLNLSINENQCIVEKLYGVLPNIRGIIPKKDEINKSISPITIVSIICIILAAVISMVIISQTDIKKDNINLKISQLDQKLDLCLSGIKENESLLKDLKKNEVVETKITFLKEELSKRLDLLENKVDEIFNARQQGDQINK